MPPVVEGPGAAHVEPRVGGVREGGGDGGARCGVGREVHEPVGVEAVDDEGPPRRPKVRAPALHRRPLALVGTQQHGGGDAAGGREEDAAEERHPRRRSASERRPRWRRQARTRRAVPLPRPIGGSGQAGQRPPRRRASGGLLLFGG